jgi:hypothetical protein
VSASQPCRAAGSAAVAACCAVWYMPFQALALMLCVLCAALLLALRYYWLHSAWA